MSVLNTSILNGECGNTIKAVIGLGNPGQKFAYNRHNIGFMVVDHLANQAQAPWQERENLLHTTIEIAGKPILLVKPQTFMNSSGEVIPWIFKKHIKAQELLVVHDELDFPFGKVACKCGGSARGHNGLRSLIEQAGSSDFCRIRCGIGRPETKEEVSSYVLSDFTQDPPAVEAMIIKAATLITELFICTT